MTLARHTLALVAALALAMFAAAPSTAQTQRVGNLASPEMLDGRHLIVTVAITSRNDANRRMADLAERFPVSGVAVWPLPSIAIHCIVVRVADGVSVAAAARQLSAEPDVQWVQPVNAFSVSSSPTYGDELYNKQRALSAMNVERAHSITTGARVRVALIDTGVDTSHPDLTRRVVVARDFVDDGRRQARETHGTAIAGVLAADGRNGRGIVGVAPDANIFSLRACWERGGRGLCTSFSLARALNFAIGQRVAIINLSLGGPNDPLVRELIDRALSAGITVVSAGGGQGFPTNVPGVIGAGGGRVPAPATDVLTTLPGGRYGFRSGTSIAAGHVSGIVALMKQSRPGATPAQIRQGLAGATARRSIDACQAVAAVARRGRLEC